MADITAMTSRNPRTFWISILELFRSIKNIGNRNLNTHSGFASEVLEHPHCYCQIKTRYYGLGQV